jgi:hypothetical protein
LPCVTIGITEKKISVSRDGWTFEGCAWCGRGVFVSEGYLKCSNDHNNPRVTPRLLVMKLFIFIDLLTFCFVFLPLKIFMSFRYKLHLEVTHHQEKTIFVFSDPACANYFGISALKLKRSLSSVCNFLYFIIQL